MTFQRIGGIYFLKLGRLRASFCLAKPPAEPLPTWHINNFYLDPRRREA
jgi:hypothetical protein